MILRIVGDAEFVAESVAAKLSERPDPQDDLSDLIELGMEELVRIHLREIAREERDRVAEHLLEQAFSMAKEDILNRGAPERIATDCQSLRERIFKVLRYPAQEVSDLSGRLAESRSRDRIGRRNRLAVKGEAAYEITRIGLRDATEGLLAQPLARTFEIDLDALGANYSVEGDWFPFEIRSGELVFVLDDNGAIYTSTQNFPDSVFERAEHELTRLAAHVYSQAR
jgi:hypothetical protein